MKTIPASVPLAVTSGEPAGIGPDLCLALAFEAIDYPFVILGDSDLLRQRAQQLGLKIQFVDYPSAAADAALSQPARGTLVVLHLPLAQPVTTGVIDPANAHYVLSLLDRALSGIVAGEFAAMVTAPIHKGVINQAGVPFSGHTEYLAEKTNTAKVVMMLAGETSHGPLRVALATTHIPLAQVASQITEALLCEVLPIMHADLIKKYRLPQPRILVAGLNPHAGEQGYLGREEIDIMAPALAKLRQQGMQLIGPLPADTLFTPTVLAQGDAVLAMYHDQGLAVLKYATFGHGINVTLGLPVIRTSVDHGVALDLAGSGRAKVGSLVEAVNQARLMAGA